MFNLDNIEFDFDDDFSSNIFSKRVTSSTGGTVKTDNITDTVKETPNQNSSKSEQTKSPSQLFNEQSSPETRTSTSNFSNFPLINASGENRLKRPHLQDEKPHKKRLSHEGLLQRRFPGPAGLLPDKPIKQISDLPLPVEKLWNEEEDNDSEKEKPIIYSQCSGSVFLESGYQKLVTDFNLNDSNNPLNRYTVEWVKKKALNKGLQGRKIPFLGLVVHVVNHSMPDPVLVLRDPTGEISGSLHREVWAEMGGKLRTGIALALRQVGVLITGVIRRQIYLNITMNNILAIYSPSENETEIEITTVNKTSKLELFKNLAEWLATSRTAPQEPPSPSFPFTTIDDSSRSSTKEEKRNFKNKGQNMDVTRGSGAEAEVLNDLGIVLSDTDFAEEMRVPQSECEREEVGGVVRGMQETGVRVGTSSQALSPAESLIFEQVLSGINLDEFEM